MAVENESIVGTDAIEVGKTRVRDEDGFVGTVMYVGPVASAKKEKEMYAGVVWDDETRGKHDGSVICRRTNQLVRHFYCKSPTGGSFLKYSKIQRGCWLTYDLLQSRYVQLHADLIAPDNILPHAARTSSGRPKPIELIGEVKIRKQQQISDLTHISLRSLFIRGIQDDLPPQTHLLEIDLAANLLSDWDQVLFILDKFPNVQRASFAANRLCDIPTSKNKKNQGVKEKMSIDIAFWRNTTMQYLNLNGCNIKSFQTIQIIGQMMPQLEELCVAHGDLSDMDQFSSTSTSLSDDTYQKLKLLDCSHCKISQWEPIKIHFGTYPSLATLILDDNPLTSITLSTDTDIHQDYFTSLTHLQLAGTLSSSLEDIHDLYLFKKLRSLRFRNNPLTIQLGTGESRASLIGRLATLCSLNGSTISKKERIEAERRYVTTIARELLTLNGDNKNDYDEDQSLKRIQKKHPRFEELMSQHKEAMVHAQSIATQQRNQFSNANTIAQCAINVTITSMSADSCTMKPIQKRLPSNLKVGRLKVMCLRAFNLDVDLQLLHFKSNESDPFPTELDEDENTLAFYGVSDGAQIYMNEVDLEAKQREAQRVAERFHQLLQEQEHAAKSLQAAKKNNEQ